MNVAFSLEVSRRYTAPSMADLQAAVDGAALGVNGLPLQAAVIPRGRMGDIQRAGDPFCLPEGDVV